MKTESGKRDPVVFAVIKARMDGIVREMVDTFLRTARNPILNICHDSTCSLLTYDAKLLTMANSPPLHVLCMSDNLGAVVKCFKDDIHPGDIFCNNSPYHGNLHVGDWAMFAPVFYEGELVCWTAAMAHLVDIGAYIPATDDPLAKDVYMEGVHIPPMRIVKDYKEVPEIIRLIKANFRYPEQWHGDLLGQIGAVWVGEREIHKLCERYGGDAFKQFQDDFLDYGDRRTIEEIKKLPRGTWSAEALSEKIESITPEGLRLKVKMSIDPDEAIISFDLTEMPDQLPWGCNLSEATSKAAGVNGSLPSLDPSLPRNDGVLRHFKAILREGSVAGIPKWPVGTSCATVDICEEIINMIFILWEEIQPGRGHGGAGMCNASIASSAGTDFRHDNAPYGHMYFIAISGGPGSKGSDGWPNLCTNVNMGNITTESVEVNELQCPEIVWEWGIRTDSAGAGKWRGGPAFYHRIQPRHQIITIVPYGTGHTAAPSGVAGGKAGSLADHWIEKNATREKVQQLYNVGLFQLKEDEDWVALSNGGGGYGDPLEREPELVRDDARNYIISIEAAADEYGVVLNTEPELYEVDYEATEKLRARLREERRMK